MPERLRFAELASLARRSARVRVQCGLNDLVRVVEHLPAQTRLVDCTLEFAPAPDGAVSVSGRLACEVDLVCQRCLESMTAAVDTAIDVIAVEPGSSFEGAGADLIDVPEQGLDLRDLVEEELLLALPVVPRHVDAETCGSLAGRLASLNEEDEVRDTHRPFADLKSLRSVAGPDGEEN